MPWKHTVEIKFNPYTSLLKRGKEGKMQLLYDFADQILVITFPECLVSS